MSITFEPVIPAVIEPFREHGLAKTPPSNPPVSAAVTVIRPSRGLMPLDWRALLRHRDLLIVLAMRDIKVRYKQAVLGIGWALLQPIAMALILYAFFGLLLGLNEQVSPTPYLIFVLAGVLPWTLFESGVTASSNSVVSNAAIIRKVYFPRILIPLAAVGAPLIDYAIGLGVLFIAMVALGVTFSWQALLLPALICSTVLAVLGIGILLAALTAAYRDFRHVVPFLLRLLFFMTPVIYPVSVVPGRWQWVLSLNPIGGTISAFRSIILGTPINYTAWGVSTLISLAAAILGLAYFQRVQRRFADIV